MTPLALAWMNDTLEDEKPAPILDCAGPIQHAADRCWCCSDAEQGSAPAKVDADTANPLLEVAEVLELGTDETGDPGAVFARPLDAAFFSGGVAVLDAVPPYVRLFAGDGTLVGTAVRRGRGPGELTRPLGITAVGDRIIVTEADRWVSLDERGNTIHTETQQNRILRGVSRGCRGGVVALAGDRGRFEPPAAVTTWTPGRQQEDTLGTVAALRSNNQRVHPFLVSATDAMVALYAEGVDEHSLLLFDCNSRVAHQVFIEPVGRQEYFEPTGPTSHALHPAAVPQPAGIAQFRGELYWLVNDRNDRAAEGGNVTVITRLRPESPHRTVIPGWYQLVDHTADRWLLLAQEPVPRVLVVDPAVFLSNPGPERGAS